MTKDKVVPYNPNENENDSSKKPETKKKPGTYDFKEHHEIKWAKGNASDADQEHPISKSWARMHDRNINVGVPLSDAYMHNDKMIQHFSLADAEFDPDEESNPNKIVSWSDARGFVGHDSGL